LLNAYGKKIVSVMLPAILAGQESLLLKLPHCNPASVFPKHESLDPRVVQHGVRLRVDVYLEVLLSGALGEGVEPYGVTVGRRVAHIDLVDSCEDLGRCWLRRAKGEDGRVFYPFLTVAGSLSVSKLPIVVLPDEMNFAVIP
jgi:hypothetical protein